MIDLLNNTKETSDNNRSTAVFNGSVKKQSEIITNRNLNLVRIMVLIMMVLTPLFLSLKTNSFLLNDLIAPMAIIGLIGFIAIISYQK